MTQAVDDIQRIQKIQKRILELINKGVSYAATAEIVSCEWGDGSSIYTEINIETLLQG